MIRANATALPCSVNLYSQIYSIAQVQESRLFSLFFFFFFLAGISVREREREREREKERKRESCVTCLGRPSAACCVLLDGPGGFIRQELHVHKLIAIGNSQDFSQTNSVRFCSAEGGGLAH